MKNEEKEFYGAIDGKQLLSHHITLYLQMTSEWFSVYPGIDT